MVVEAAGEELAVEVDPAVGAPAEPQEAESMVSATMKAAIPAGRPLPGKPVICESLLPSRLRGFARRSRLERPHVRPGYGFFAASNEMITTWVKRAQS